MRNKPNFRRTGHPIIPLFHHSSPVPIVRNKPNFPDAEIVANCGSQRGLGEEYADMASEKTKPISRVHQRGRVPLRTNKATSHQGGEGRSGLSLAPRPSGSSPGVLQKQTQFAAGACRTNKANLPAVGIPHHSTIPLSQHSSPMRIVRNKANCRQTGFPSFHYSIIPVFQSEGCRAKQSQFARTDHQKALVGKAAAKQRQFPPVRPTRWTWNPPPYAGHILPLCHGQFWLKRRFPAVTLRSSQP